MKNGTDPNRGRRARAVRMIEPAAWVLAAALVVCSAVAAKEAGSVPSLVSVETRSPRVASPTSPVILASRVEQLPAHIEEPEVRWFDGRPVRPARTIWMTVTAYSPDAASCGEYADGQTATLHSVSTNAGHLVAADPTVLPYGTMITVAGYAGGDIVPVLDCGGAIKGRRLDVLYPTHARARDWGVRRIPVVVWEYADGLPAPNPRKVR